MISLVIMSKVWSTYLIWIKNHCSLHPFTSFSFKSFSTFKLQIIQVLLYLQVLALQCTSSPPVLNPFTLFTAVHFTCIAEFPSHASHLIVYSLSHPTLYNSLYLPQGVTLFPAHSFLQQLTTLYAPSTCLHAKFLKILKVRSLSFQFLILLPFNLFLSLVQSNAQKW